MKKLELLLNEDRSDEILQDITETKLQLNWEIDKEEIFWE